MKKEFEKKKPDDIDILLSTYNGENFLEDLLTSLLNQTYKDFHLLVRDDGSDDDTLKILNSFENKFSNKMRIVKDSLGNIGSNRSFMQLLSYSKSPYIMFCDQDDFWLPEKIEFSFNKIAALENEYGQKIPTLVFTDLIVADKNFNRISDSFWKYQRINPKTSKNWKYNIVQNVVTGCTLIINSSAREVCMPYSLPQMDYDRWIAVNISKEGIIDFIETPTILYRQHGNNIEGAYQFSLFFLLKKIKSLKNLTHKYIVYSRYFKISFINLLFTKIRLNIKRLLNQ